MPHRSTRDSHRASPTADLVVVGSVNTDLVAEVGQLPGPGQTILGYRFEQFGGGKGANAAVAAVRLGASVSLIGAIGWDSL
jgi:ribokinase